MDIPKETSNEYGSEYQSEQVQKFRERKSNHWKYRLNVGKELVEKHVADSMRGRATDEIVIVDIGCSIGTFAIDFASQGYVCYGIDFDQSAIDIAQRLAEEEGVAVEFVVGDVATWPSTSPKIDIALCMDIFEHLHDDELGAFLAGIRPHFSDDGALVFHTFPTQYDHLFFGRKLVRAPLYFFRWLSERRFMVFTKMYSSLMDIVSLLVRGSTHKESIKRAAHCNPLSRERLADILRRCGYDIDFIETGNLYPFSENTAKAFQRHSLSHRNIFGVARPKCT